MKEILKKVLLRILWRLLEGDFGSNQDENDKQMQHWLAWSFGDPGCMKYIEMRERQIIQGLLIDGLAPLPRDSFQRKSGQRFEVLGFKLKIEKAHLLAHNKKLESDKGMAKGK